MSYPTALTLAASISLVPGSCLATLDEASHPECVFVYVLEDSVPSDASLFLPQVLETFDRSLDP